MVGKIGRPYFFPRDVLMESGWSIISIYHVLAPSQCLHEAEPFWLRSERHVGITWWIRVALSLVAFFLDHFTEEFLDVSSLVFAGNPVAAARVDLSESSPSLLRISHFVCSSLSKRCSRLVNRCWLVSSMNDREVRRCVTRSSW